MKEHEFVFQTLDGKALFAVSFNPSSRRGGLALRSPLEYGHELDRLSPTPLEEDGTLVWRYGIPVSIPQSGPAQVKEGYSRAHEIDADDLQQFLQSTGKSLLVLTGAGISAAAGVWTIEALQMHLHLESIESLVEVLSENPETLVQRFGLFVLQLYCKNPTPAHVALKALQDLLGFTVATENRDNLHQKTGLIPIERDSIPSLSFDDYSGLLIVGVSQDRFSMIPSFRNRGLSVVCIGPAHCSGVTDWLREDCQQVLPAVARLLSREGK